MDVCAVPECGRCRIVFLDWRAVGRGLLSVRADSAEGGGTAIADGAVGRGTAIAVYAPLVPPQTATWSRAVRSNCNYWRSRRGRFAQQSARAPEERPVERMGVRRPGALQTKEDAQFQCRRLQHKYLIPSMNLKCHPHTFYPSMNHCPPLRSPDSEMPPDLAFFPEFLPYVRRFCR